MDKAEERVDKDVVEYLERNPTVTAAQLVRSSWMPVTLATFAVVAGVAAAMYAAALWGPSPAHEDLSKSAFVRRSSIIGPAAAHFAVVVVAGWISTFVLMAVLGRFKHPLTVNRFASAAVLAGVTAPFFYGALRLATNEVWIFGAAAMFGAALGLFAGMKQDPKLLAELTSAHTRWRDKRGAKASWPLQTTGCRGD